MTHTCTGLMMQCGRDVSVMFGNPSNGVVEVEDDGWLGLTGERGSLDFNMCFVAHTASRAVVERYVKEIKSRDLAAIMIVDEDSPDLIDAATRLGLAPVGQVVPVMVWESGPELDPAHGYDVRIASADDHSVVCRLVAEAFSLDEALTRRAMTPETLETEGFEAWIVERDGEALGTGWFVVSENHVGVYSMSTPERHQRQGVGRAVLESAMSHHLARGAKTFTLEASDAGFHLYEQLGYRTVARPSVLIAG